jgi:hypothetical protein
MAHATPKIIRGICQKLGVLFFLARSRFSWTSVLNLGSNSQTLGQGPAERQRGTAPSGMRVSAQPGVAKERSTSSADSGQPTPHTMSNPD